MKKFLLLFGLMFLLVQPTLAQCGPGGCPVKGLLPQQRAFQPMQQRVYQPVQQQMYQPIQQRFMGAACPITPTAPCCPQRQSACPCPCGPQLMGAACPVNPCAPCCPQLMGAACPVNPCPSCCPQVGAACPVPVASPCYPQYRVYPNPQILGGAAPFGMGMGCSLCPCEPPKSGWQRFKDNFLGWD